MNGEAPERARWPKKELTSGRASGIWLWGGCSDLQVSLLRTTWHCVGSSSKIHTLPTRKSKKDFFFISSEPKEEDNAEKQTAALSDQWDDSTSESLKVCVYLCAFKTVFISLSHMCAHVHNTQPWRAWSQKTAYRNQFSPSILWVLGINLGPTDSVVRTSTHRALLLACFWGWHKDEGKTTERHPEVKIGF